MWRYIQEISLLLLIVVTISCKSDPQRVEQKIDDQSYFVHIQNEKIGGLIHGHEYANKKAEDYHANSYDLVVKGKYKQARRAAEKALELDSINPMILNSIGLIYRAEEDYSKAVEYLNRSIVHSDSNSMIPYFNLASTYYYQENYEECIRLASSIISKTDNLLIKMMSHFIIIESFITQRKCIELNEQFSIVEKLSKDNSVFEDQIRTYSTNVIACFEYEEFSETLDSFSSGN